MTIGTLGTSLVARRAASPLLLLKFTRSQQLHFRLRLNIGASLSPGLPSPAMFLRLASMLGCTDDCYSQF
jgi:hypothetical protein